MNEPPIVNPDNYLSYLTLEIGAQYEVFRNVHILALGACICDLLFTVPQEVKMIRSRFTLSISAYWLARIFAFVNLTLVVFSATGPVNHCRELLLGTVASYILTGAATSFLFLLRVRAVFFRNKLVHWCFSALWVTTIVVWALAPIGVDSIEIADTKHCISTQSPRFLVIGSVMPLVYDSLIFLAISFKVVTTYGLPQYPLTWRTFFSRPLSHHIPRAVLHGGQQYYLVSVCVNIIAVLLLVISTVPPYYRGIIIAPGTALTSSMACRVFRNLFLKNTEGGGTAAVELTTIIRQTGVTSGATLASQDAPRAVA